MSASAELISCRNLPRLREIVTSGKPIKASATESFARITIARSIDPGTEIVDQPLTLPDLDLPIVEDLFHQRLIRRTREVSQKSRCWATQVGCVVVNSRGREIVQGESQPLCEAQDCMLLKVRSGFIRSLLGQNQRLDFCVSNHDVATAVSRAATSRKNIAGKIWGLSLEPCENCAGLLIATQAKEVYFSTGMDRERYYISEGLRRLVGVGVPTFFVKMPGEER